MYAPISKNPLKPTQHVLYDYEVYIIALSSTWDSQTSEKDSISWNPEFYKVMVQKTDIITPFKLINQNFINLPQWRERFILISLLSKNMQVTSIYVVKWQ